MARVGATPWRTAVSICLGVSREVGELARNFLAPYFSSDALWAILLLLFSATEAESPYIKRAVRIVHRVEGPASSTNSAGV